MNQRNPHPVQTAGDEGKGEAADDRTTIDNSAVFFLLENNNFQRTLSSRGGGADNPSVGKSSTIVFKEQKRGRACECNALFNCLCCPVGCQSHSTVDEGFAVRPSVFFQESVLKTNSSVAAVFYSFLCSYDERT